MPWRFPRMRRPHLEGLPRGLCGRHRPAHLPQGGVGNRLPSRALRVMGRNGAVRVGIFRCPRGLCESRISTTSNAMDLILGRAGPMKV